MSNAIAIASTGITPPRGATVQGRELMGGIQITFTFPNGWGASVVRHRGSYGHQAGLFELAVLDRDGHLSYDTPITDDVIGHLTPTEVDGHLAAIAVLPTAP